MRQILKLILILALALTLESCIYDKMYHFKKEDLVWLSAYSLGDSVLFQSNRGNTDTLIVTYLHSSDNYDRFYSEWTIPPQTSYAVALCEFTLKSENDSIEGKIFLWKVSDSDLLISSILNMRYTDNFGSKEGHIQIPVFC